MKVTIKNDLCQVTGEYGWYAADVSGRNWSVDLDEMILATSPDLLVHDILDHAVQTDMGHFTNEGELSALGAILNYREHDFYNIYGVDGFSFEISEQLRYLLYIMVAPQYVPDTRHVDARVWDRLNGNWDEIISDLDSDIEEFLGDKTNYESVTEMPKLSSMLNNLKKYCAYYLDQGYKHVTHVEKQGIYYGSVHFLLKETLSETIFELDPEEADYVFVIDIDMAKPYQAGAYSVREVSCVPC